MSPHPKWTPMHVTHTLFVQGVHGSGDTTVVHAMLRTHLISGEMNVFLMSFMCTSQFLYEAICLSKTDISLSIDWSCSAVQCEVSTNLGDCVDRNSFLFKERPH